MPGRVSYGKPGDAFPERKGPHKDVSLPWVSGRKVTLLSRAPKISPLAHTPSQHEEKKSFELPEIPQKSVVFTPEKLSSGLSPGSVKADSGGEVGEKADIIDGLASTIFPCSAPIYLPPISSPGSRALLSDPEIGEPEPSPSLEAGEEVPGSSAEVDTVTPKSTERRPPALFVTRPDYLEHKPPSILVFSPDDEGDTGIYGSMEMSTLDSYQTLFTRDEYKDPLDRVNGRVFNRAMESCRCIRLDDTVEGEVKMDSTEFLRQQIRKFPAWADIQDNAEITVDNIGGGASGAKVIKVEGRSAAVLKSATRMPKAVQRGLLEEVKQLLQEERFKGLSPEELNDCLDEVIDEVLDSDNAGMVAYVPFYGMAAREQIASVIGHELFNVPETFTIFDEEHGLCSLQEFSEGTESLTRSLSSDHSLEILNNMDLQSFQDLAVLDMLISNYDRHHLNVLFKPEEGERGAKYHLIPIDHGGTIPSKVYRRKLKLFWEDDLHSVDKLTDATFGKMKSLDFRRLREDIAEKMGDLKETRILDHLQLMTTFLNVCGTSGSKSWTCQDLLGAMSRLEDSLWDRDHSDYEDLGMVDNLRKYAEREGLTYEEACRQAVEEAVDEYIIGKGDG